MKLIGSSKAGLKCENIFPKYIKNKNDIKINDLKLRCIKLC